MFFYEYYEETYFQFNFNNFVRIYKYEQCFVFAL